MKKTTLQRAAVVAAVTLLSLWLIYPTFRYFLAVGDKESYTTEQLDEMKTRSVPLGLDLQGGVDVLLAVDVQETRRSQVNELADQIRREFSKESPSIEATVEATSGTENIAITVQRADQIRAAQNILGDLAKRETFADFDAASLKAGQPLSLQVRQEFLRQDIAQTVDSSVKVIRDRVDSLGVTQPIIVKQGEDRIRVQIPGEKNPQKAIETVIKPARLEFRGVLSSQQPQPDGDGGQVYPEISSQYIDPATGKLLEGKKLPPGYEVLPMRNRTTGKDQVAQTLTTYMVVKKQPEMTGKSLRDAHVSVSQGGLNAGQIEVIVEFNREGTDLFDQISQKYIDKRLAVILDDVVYTAPVVQGRISGGTCQITGGFTQEEAQDLSLILKAGALPAELIAKDMRTVEASLGADSIMKSVYALAIGSLVVGVYMIAYYGAAGVIAVIAVLINVILIFAFMKLANATLTLSGIGGILLTVGMAVDANILIYERIREELRLGKPLKQAIQLGFGRAFSVIFDANLTTLISGLVLLQFGEGSVKGFALSLNIGIIATLFTGLFVTKTLVDMWYEKLSTISFGKFSWFRQNLHIDFLSFRKISYAFSSVLFLVCLLYVLPFKPFPGSNWGVDFEGGLLSEVSVTKPIDTEKVKGSFEDWRVQKVAGEDKFLVRTKLDDTQQTLDQAKADVVTRLDQTIGQGGYTIESSEAVSNEVGKEFTSKAILACIFAAIGILIYLAFRFEFTYGFAAVVALFHDVVIAYGIFNMMGDAGLAGEVTLDVVAALLVVIGYSVNDTIIIFDRIRENKGLNPTGDEYQMINTSISESLNRTVVTVSTVVIVLAIMMAFGGSGLYDFALVMLLGIVKGTYSSCFLASPILYDIHQYNRKKGTKVGSTKVRPMLNNKA